MRVYLAIHIICGVLAYGIEFADSQAHCRRLGGQKFADRWYRKDMSFSVFTGLLGPIGFMASFFYSGFAEHGLKFK